jgi:cytidylate kinase
MAIITISRGSYSRGKEVAEKVGKQLGYTCISRDILLETSKRFNIPEIKLVRAIHDAPSVLGRFAYGKEKYIAFIEAAILQHFKENDTVYCGLAGHFFVRGVPHVLKVRILAEFEDRLASEMKRKGIGEKEAANLLRKDDEERKKWSKYLYGIDTGDPILYDLVIHIKKIGVDDAVEIICKTVGLQHFQTTPQSQKMVEDLALAAQVRAALVDLKPDVEVQASDGSIRIHTAVNESKDMAVVKEMEKIGKSIPGVREVTTEVRPIDPVD